MARPITAGDQIPTSPPLKVLAVGKRIDGHVTVDVAVPADHPAAAALLAGALSGVSLPDDVEVTGLIGHPGPEQDA